MKSVYAYLIAGIIIVIELSKLIVNTLINYICHLSEKKKDSKKEDKRC